MSRIALIALMLALGCSSAHAQTPSNAPIPNRVFGPQTHHVFLPDCATGLPNCFDNASVDDQWNKAQDGTALLHQVSEDGLGRTGGWMEAFATGGYMEAAVVVNHYGASTDTTGAQVAFADLLGTIEANSVQLMQMGYPSFTGMTRPRFDVPSGQSAAWSLTDGTDSLYLFGMWRDTSEVEGEVIYPAHAQLAGRAKKGLVAAVRAALVVDAR